MCLQASWGLTHTQEGQEGNVWIKGEGETESYKGQKLYPWLLHILLHYNDPISLYFNARKDVVSMSSNWFMHELAILISAPLCHPTTCTCICICACMSACTLYTVPCVICNVCSLLFVKVVDFTEVGKQTVLQSFEGFWCGRIVHCCCIVL